MPQDLSNRNYQPPIDPEVPSGSQVAALPVNNKAANNQAASKEQDDMDDKGGRTPPTNVLGNSASPLKPNLPALKSAEDSAIVLRREPSPDKPPESSHPVEQSLTTNRELTPEALAERLKRKPRSMLNMFYEKPAEFPQWSKQRDPDGIAWQRSERKQGRAVLFTPVQEPLEGTIE